MKNYDFMNPKQEINTELYMVNEADNIKEFEKAEAEEQDQIVDTLTWKVLPSAEE